MERIYILFAVTLVSLAALILPQTADAKTAATSAAMTMPIELTQKADDNRAQILARFLDSHHSPLAIYAQTLVAEADKNNIDWKLVAAISGVESTFGQAIPADSYNGWGFGIYGNNVRRFGSWDDGITVVSTSIRQDYMNKWGAKSLPEIGAIYAASPTWAYRVQNFMNDIDEFKANSTSALTLSL